MRNDSGKICGMDNVQERQEMTKGENDLSCTICCATSDDPTKLCAPAKDTENLFCKDFSGN
jgi:hypothetical protein